MTKYTNPRRRREDPVRWMVTRERFQLPDTEAPAAEQDASVRDVVNDIFRNIEKRRQPGLLDQIRDSWSDLAGPGAAKHARPGYLNRDTLVVFVDSAVWLDELSRYARAGILARLQQRFGSTAITNLRLQADPGERRTAVSGNHYPPPT